MSIFVSIMMIIMSFFLFLLLRNQWLFEQRQKVIKKAYGYSMSHNYEVWENFEMWSYEKSLFYFWVFNITKMTTNPEECKKVLEHKENEGN